MFSSKFATPEGIFLEMYLTFGLQASLLQKCAVDVPEYIENILKIWIYETDHFDKYLIHLPPKEHDHSFKTMRKIWQRQMVDKMLTFIENGFWKMLENDSQMSLCRCFHVLQNAETGLEKIPGIFGDFVECRARLIISVLPGVDQTDFQNFVSKLVALRVYFSKMTAKCFNRHDCMFLAMAKAFHNVLHNNDESAMARGPKLLALYWDSCLKKKNAVFDSRDKISESLKLCAVSHNILDYAEENFKLLFHRLINDCCYYCTLEVKLVKRLTTALNAENKDLLKRGARALEDIRFKFSLNEAYQQYKNTICKKQKIASVSTAFLILQERFWTHVFLMDYESECELPDFCEASIAHFEKFYAVFACGRSLKWMHHLSTAEVDINLSETPCTVRATLFGVAILFCFQDRDEMSLQLIQEKTRMKPFVLLQESKLLIDFGLLNKSSSNELTMSAILTLNLHFPEERIRSGIFFPEEKNLEKERQARPKLTAARRVTCATECKERLNARHIELCHPPMNPGRAHAPEPPERHFSLDPTLTDCFAVVNAKENVKSVPLLAANIPRKADEKSDIEHLVKNNIEAANAEIGESTVTAQCVQPQKTLNVTVSISSGPSENDFNEAIEMLENSLRALHHLPTTSETPECLTSIMIKSSDNNNVSEDDFHVSTVVVKKLPEVIDPIPKESQEEIPQKSLGAIPKVCQCGNAKCKVLTTDTSWKDVTSEEKISCKFDKSVLTLDVDEVLDIFHELCLGRNVFVGRSVASFWLRDVLDVPPDDEISLEFCKKNLEKNVILATNALLVLFSQHYYQPDGAAEGTAQLLQSEIFYLSDIISVFQSTRCPTQDVLLKSACNATQPKDLPCQLDPRTKKNRKTKERKIFKKKPKQIAETKIENFAGASNVTPPESFLLPSLKICKSEKQSPSFINFHTLDARKSSKSESRRETELTKSNKPEACTGNKTSQANNFTASTMTQAKSCTVNEITKDGKDETWSKISISTGEDGVLDYAPSALSWPKNGPFSTETQQNYRDPSRYSSQELRIFDDGCSMVGSYRPTPQKKPLVEGAVEPQDRRMENCPPMNALKNITTDKIPPSMESPVTKITVAIENNPQSKKLKKNLKFVSPDKIIATLKISLVNKMSLLQKTQEMEEAPEVEEKLPAIATITLVKITPETDKIQASEGIPVIVSMAPQELGNTLATNSPKQCVPATDSFEAVECITVNLSSLSSPLAPENKMVSSTVKIFLPPTPSSFVTGSTLVNGSPPIKNSTPLSCSSPVETSTPLASFSSVKGFSTVKSLAAAARASGTGVRSFTLERVNSCSVCERTLCPTVQLRRRPQHPRVQAIKKENI